MAHNSTPVLGEVRIGKEINKNRSNEYMWCACRVCGKERWVRLVHGEPRDSRCGECGFQGKGMQHHSWAGGRRIQNGYIDVWLPPSSPFRIMANSYGYVREHRLVMAQHLGRALHSWELIHHKNGQKTDNRLENLELVSSSTHRQIEALLEEMKTLQQRVTLLEAQNSLLQIQLQSSIECGGWG